MAYKLVYNWLPSSKYALKSPFTMTPKYITLHNSWNDAPAKNEIAFMLRYDSLTGFHVAIDDIEAIQAIPFTRMAYHAGDGNGSGNRASVGIEICYSKSGGDRYRKAEANAIEYTAKLLVSFSLPVS